MKKGSILATALLALPIVAAGQQSAAPLPATPPAQATVAQPAATRISMDDAIRLALQHNHALQAARTTIHQSQAHEITANLRPNPDAGTRRPVPPFPAQQIQFGLHQPAGTVRCRRRLPVRTRQEAPASPASRAGSDRCHALPGRRQRTPAHLQRRPAVRRRPARPIHARIRRSRISTASRRPWRSARSAIKPATISEGDFLKIKLQLLQFQTDDLRRQARQGAGPGRAAPARWDLSPCPTTTTSMAQLDYQPVHGDLDDLKALALRTRPDLRAAQQGVIAARSRNCSQKPMASAIWRQLQLLPRRRHQLPAHFFFNMPAPNFRSQSGRNRAHSLRPSPSPRNWPAKPPQQVSHRCG